MRVLTLGEVSQMGPGELVPAFKAQVKEVKKYHTGNNQYGPWSIQKITVMDQTAIMTLKLVDHPEMTSQWVGHWIYLEAIQGNKGLHGLAVIDDEYRGKKERMIEAKKDVPVTAAQAGAP